MNLIKIQFFYLLFCLTFVSACSSVVDTNPAREILLKYEKKPSSPTYQEQAKKETLLKSSKKPSPPTYQEQVKEELLKAQNLNLEELRRQVKVYTFEDFKSMTDEEFSKEFYRTENTAVFWFKDFKQWKIEELDNDRRTSFMYLLHLYSKNLATKGNYNKIFIDNDGIIFNITLEQLKNITSSKLTWSGVCFGLLLFEQTNYYSIEYIQQLNANQLRAFHDCLSEEQLLALTNEQIIGSEIFHTTGRVVPFSPERLKSFGDGLEKMPCRTFIKLDQNQISILTPKQIGWARKRSHWHDDFEWCWTPEQIAWLTPNQISGLLIDDRTRLHREHIEALNDEQLKGFSEDQILRILHNYIRFFSPTQLRVLEENNTASDIIKKVIDFQDEGPDIFDGYLDYLSSSHPELTANIYSLLPEQFTSLRFDQVLSLPFDVHFELTPDQISMFPNFVKVLNFSDYTWIPFRVRIQHKIIKITKSYTPIKAFPVLVEKIEKIEENLYRMYGTLNHAKLLNREQVRAIPPEQIPDVLPSNIETLYKRNFDQEEYDAFNRGYTETRIPLPIYKTEPSIEENKKYIVGLGEEYEGQYEIPLTLDQFKNMTLEQFEVIYNEYTGRHELKYLTAPYVNTLSLEKVNVLLDLVKDETSPDADHISPETKRLLERKSQIQ